jgi:hypothetical protein
MILKNCNSAGNSGTTEEMRLYNRKQPFTTGEQANDRRRRDGKKTFYHKKKRFVEKGAGIDG